MQTVSLFDAKTDLSCLIEQNAFGREDEIVISRNGKPVARLMPMSREVSRRIGVARGEFDVPNYIDRCNAEIAEMLPGQR